MSNALASFQKGVETSQNIRKARNDEYAQEIMRKDYEAYKEAEGAELLTGKLTVDSNGENGIFELGDDGTLKVAEGGLEYMMSGNVKESEMAELLSSDYLLEWLKTDAGGGHSIEKNQFYGRPMMVRGQIPTHLLEAEAKGLLTDDQFFTAEDPEVKEGKAQVGEVKVKGTATQLAEWKEDIDSGRNQKSAVMVPVYTQQDGWSLLSRWRTDKEDDVALVLSGNQVATMLEDAVDDLQSRYNPNYTEIKLLNSNSDAYGGTLGMGKQGQTYHDIYDDYENTLVTQRRDGQNADDVIPGDKVTLSAILTSEIDELNAQTNERRERRDNELNNITSVSGDPDATTQVGIVFNQNQKRYEKSLKKISFMTSNAASSRHGTTYINQGHVDPFRLFPELSKIKESGTLDGINSKHGVVSGMFKYWQDTEEGQGVRSTLDQNWKDLLADPERLRVLADNYQLAVQQDLSNLGALEDKEGEIPFDLNYFGDFVTGTEDAQVLLQNQVPPDGGAGTPVQGDKFADTPLSTGDRPLNPRTSNPFPWSYPGYEEGHKQIWESLGSPNIHESELRAIIASGNYPGGPNDTGNYDFKTLEERKGASPSTQTEEVGPATLTLNEMFPSLVGLEGSELTDAVEKMREEGTFAESKFSPETIARIDSWLESSKINNADDLKAAVDRGEVKDPYKTSLLMSMALSDHTGMVLGMPLKDATERLFNYITTGDINKGPADITTEKRQQVVTKQNASRLNLEWQKFISEQTSGSATAFAKKVKDIGTNIDGLWNTFKGSWDFRNMSIDNDGVVSFGGAGFDSEKFDSESEQVILNVAETGRTSGMYAIAEEQWKAALLASGKYKDESQLPAFTDMDYVRLIAKTPGAGSYRPDNLHTFVEMYDKDALKDLMVVTSEWGDVGFWEGVWGSLKNWVGVADEASFAEYWNDVWAGDATVTSISELQDRFVLIQDKDGAGLKLAHKKGTRTGGAGIEAENSVPLEWILSEGIMPPDRVNHLIDILPVVNP